MSEIEKTSIQIPSDILIEIKAMAVKEGTTQNTIINNLIVKGMEKTKQKGKIKAEVINHKMHGYDPDKKLSFKDSVGIIEVDNPEKINVQELKDSIHYNYNIYLKTF